MSANVSQVRTVTSVEARAAILRCFKVKRPVFLWGPMGIGKSDLAASIADELGGLLIDMRLATMDQTDLRGIPYFDKNQGVMAWAPPIELPSEDLAAQYPVIVLFLDEMNSASPTVQAAAYQLVLNRRVGTYKLPDNVVIMAAGNRESDKGVTYRMPAPLANRFVHLEMRHDFDAWQEWAVQNKIDKDVIGFLAFKKSALFDFDPRSPSRSFATPRSWTFVSELIAGGGSDSTMTDLVAGAVGEGNAVSFMAHRKVAGMLPDPRDILNGKATKLETKEISAMYSLVISMCYELKDSLEKAKAEGKKGMDAWNKQADNFFRFSMDNFTTEIVVMGSRIALTTYNLPFVPTELKNFDEFHKRYSKYIMAAVS